MKEAGLKAPIIFPEGQLWDQRQGTSDLRSYAVLCKTCMETAGHRADFQAAAWEVGQEAGYMRRLCAGTGTE